jgi:glyoxylase-like metal-dependent hydrolase (beta-lactamase superfamily II)
MNTKLPKAEIITTGSMFVDINAMFRNLNTPESEKQKINSGLIYFNALYLQQENERIIFDPGPGSYAARAFPGYQYAELRDPDDYLKQVSCQTFEITDIFLTHLHFDHCLALFSFENEKSVPVFPNARIHVSRKQRDYVNDLPVEEYDSFLFGFDKLLQDNYTVCRYEEGEKPGFVKELFFSDGHTPGMMIPTLEIKNEILIFASDLFPGRVNLEMDMVSDYDQNPKLLRMEKIQFINKLKMPNSRFIFFHDRR